MCNLASGRSLCTLSWFCHPNTNQAYQLSHTEEANGKYEQTLLYKGAGIHVLICQRQAINLISYLLKKKSPTNQACGLLPAYLWAFLSLPCRWPWIISSIFSVGHSSWSVSSIYQMSWFTHSFWVDLVNFVVHLEERVQKQDSGNLLFKPWKTVSCHGLMLNNGWCSSLLSNTLLEHILKN